MGCTSAFPAGTVSMVATIITNGVPGAVTTTTFTGGGINAFSVQIRFQSTDFKSSTAVSAYQEEYTLDSAS
jgi:hypothetical protein